MDIKIQGLNKRINRREILKDINITFKEGQITAIVGKNGCGKTTLMKEMLGIFASETDIAYVSQDTKGDINLPIKDVVSLGRYKGKSFYYRENEQDEKIVNEAMMLTETEELRERIFDSLSGGEKQRVMIARAIAQDSEWIFLDEPGAHLDVRHNEILIRLLKRIRDEKGKSIIVILHDINAALSCADTIAVMKDGRIIHNGKANPEVLSRAFDVVFEGKEEGYYRVSSVDI